MSLKTLQVEFILLFVMSMKYATRPTMAVITPSQRSENNEVTKAFNARSVGRSLAECLSSYQLGNCLKNELLDILEAAAQDNSTWHYSDILAIERDESSSQENQNLTEKLQEHQQRRQQRSFGDEVAEKLMQIAQTRSLRFRLPSGSSNSRLAGVSDALDPFLKPVVVSNPTLLTSFDEEGRKKKDKDKNMAVMGGMAMIAVVAQMFLSKVILIAGAAFIMAKIALLISLLGSLKKGTSGGGGSATEHVYISGGGGHSHDSGWHRSMPFGYTKLKAESGEIPGGHSTEEHGSHAGPPVTAVSNGGFQPSFYTAHESDVEVQGEKPAFL